MRTGETSRAEALSQKLGDGVEQVAARLAYLGIGPFQEMKLPADRQELFGIRILVEAYSVVADDQLQGMIVVVGKLDVDFAAGTSGKRVLERI